VVLDSPALENTAGVGDGVTLRPVGEALLVLGVELMALAGAAPVAADGMADLVAPYLRARDDHVVGEVVVRAYRDATRPSAPPVPLEGVSVMLLPYSAGVESELDEIKEHQRDSLKHYMGAAADVDSLRKAYESDLLWVGGGELIRGEVSNAQGLVKLVGVPVGEWVLLAWREEAHPGKAPKVRPQETKGFRDIPVSVGHSIVTYWWMRVRVRAGETTPVDLNDRNVWIAAVQEHFQLMQGTANPPTRRRR
jgi:hypothetical protein